MSLSLFLRSLTRRVLAMLFAWVLVLVPLSSRAAGAQDSPRSEYEWKANFLAKSANFVDWTEESFPPTSPAFRVCVFGSFSFGTSLAEITRAVAVRGKRMEVKWVRKEADLAGCQIVFVSQSESKRYGKVLDAAHMAHALTVGETADFTEAGGMVSLLMQGSELKFEVNLDAMSDAHLKMSSQLLALARRVINRSAAARG